MSYGQPYATCSVCRQPFAITKGGNMYPHNSRGKRCPGSGRLPRKDHRLGYLPARSCNDPEHNAERAREAERIADMRYGTPCIACGAPIRGGAGHDDGCAALALVAL